MNKKKKQKIINKIKNIKQKKSKENKSYLPLKAE